ncbi:hypothetical protein ACFQ7O_31220 [Streptomyces sp. NPDC056485]|uniref:hypothetical protein n=1 Tax=Streptomyces sp. NPDC056485 TaxID=3345834 RepID=UPI0036A99C4B
MGNGLFLPAEFRSEVEAAFSFLLEEAGFTGPERTEHGLLFRGPGLDVDVWLFDGREPQVSTGMAAVGPDGIRGRWASLDELYVAAGCGPAQDVPGSAPTRRSAIKRVHQHATALRRLMAGLPTPGLGRLIIRCTGS